MSGAANEGLNWFRLVACGYHVISHLFGSIFHMSTCHTDPSLSATGKPFVSSVVSTISTPSLKSYQHRFLQGVFVALILVASIATVLVTTTGVFAQTDVPDAPTAVAVYTIESQKLEVRWSSSDGTSTDSFKIQWKSGSEEFDSSRQMTSDPSTTIESDQSTSEGDRYVDIITGLTDGTEYTVQVIAANSNGDSDPSTTATGTPASEPGQAREFWENEVVSIFEDSFPWLRETWDYITAENVPVTWSERVAGGVSIPCTHVTPSMLRECDADGAFIKRSYFNLIYGITHELAHVYTLATGVASTPGPLAMAHLYFNDLINPGDSSYERFCAPEELYTDALTVITLGDDWPAGGYWLLCEQTPNSVNDEALAVVRSASAGSAPAWFESTYDDASSNPDLARVWMDVKAFRNSKNRAAAIFQLREKFGGYCDNQKATDSAFGSGVTRNPWHDGGCVPDAPTNASVTAVGGGKLSVSWQEPSGDGGSPLEGYKVQWKTGTQEYDSSRQVLVTDLTKIVWSQTISGLTNDESHTIRVLAYNHNGDGTAAELTATPTATDATAPVLLLSRFDSRSVRLIWNEALDASSRPEASAFTVNVNGASHQISEVAVQGNAVLLSVEGTIATTDELTVRYVVPTGSGAAPLKDSAGNNTPGITTRTVRNDLIQLVITDPGPDKIYILGRGFGGQDSVEVTVTFSESVIVSDFPELNLEIGGESRPASYHSGSGTKSLVFRYEVMTGVADSEGIRVESSGEISKLRGPGKVRYASTKVVVPARLRSSIRTDYLVDGVRPRGSGGGGKALVNGNDVTLTWSKALDEDSAPTTTGTRFFRVRDTSDNSSRQITAINVSGNVVTLTLASTISATDQLYVLYQNPFSCCEVTLDDHHPLKDTLGNHAISSGFGVSITQSANNPPEFPSGEDGGRSVAENTPAGRNIGSPIAATDADNDRRTYSISGIDAASFNVVATSGQLRTKGALDHESRSSYSFTMSVTDNKDIHGNADTTIDDTIDVTVTVEGVDEPPVISGISTIDDYAENGTGDVAAYSASDPEGDTDITWSLAGTDRGDFDITGGVLTFLNSPDYERGGDNHYEVTVQATDSTNKRGELHVDVIVTNVDEPPVLSGPETVDNFPENSAMSRQVGRYSATDPEGATVTLTLTAGSDDFTLSGSGVLTFDESPDYEEQSSHSVTVRATAGTHTTDRVVTVNIRNVEETGTITLSAVQPQEGTQITATLEDDDGPTGTTWQWYRTSSSGGSGTAITSATARSYTPDTDDIGSYLRVVASYDDGYADSKSASTVSANRVQEAPPVPEPPVFPSGGDYERSIRENLPAGRNLGAPVTATDGDNDRLTYSIAASDYFEIAGATGQLRTKTGLDREDREQHFITVTATDPGGLTDTVFVTVTVEDMDEQPEVSGPTSLEFGEGTSTGTTLATYTSTDPDRKGIDLVLSGTDSEDFNISNSGVLRFNEVPDFEEPADSNRDSRYQVTVEAQEQGDGTSVGRLNVAIRVTNADEPGSVVTNIEEPRVGQTVRLRVEDADGGVSVTKWEWERGDPSGSCSTVTTWETITSARSSSYTTTAADQGHCLRVTVFYSDRAGTGRTEQFITSGTVETGPFFTQDPPAYSVQENSAEGRNIGRVQARHSSSGEALNYRLGGAGARYFTIDNSAQLKTGATPLDYENNPGSETAVEITAEDSNGRTATITVTISVTDECSSAGEPPCAPGRPGVSSASDTSLSVTWSAPRTPSGSSLTGYDLQFRESDSGSGWIPQSVTGTDRSHTIENLTKDTAYEVQVRAQNDSSGYGEWSESGTGTPGSSGGGGGGGGGGVPPAVLPVFGDGASTSRSVAASASAGTAVGDPVSASHATSLVITYSLSGADAAQFTIDTSTSQIRVGPNASLVSEQTYAVTVTARDSTGGEAYIDVVITAAAFHRYDLNGNGTFEKEEVLEAINDYLFGDGLLTKEQVLEIIEAYLFG